MDTFYKNSLYSYCFEVIVTEPYDVDFTCLYLEICEYGYLYPDYPILFTRCICLNSS